MPNKLFQAKQTEQTQEDPGWLWKLAAFATRLGSGYGSSVLAADPGLGTALGASLAGGGESAAEWMEGSPQSKTRIATEAGLGAVPLGKFLKSARPALSIAKGILHGEGSNLIRRKETEGHFLPNTVGEAAWDAAGIGLGGLAGAAAAKHPRVSGPGGAPKPAGVDIGEIVNEAATTPKPGAAMQPRLAPVDKAKGQIRTGGPEPTLPPASTEPYKPLRPTPKQDLTSGISKKPEPSVTPKQQEDLFNIRKQGQSIPKNSKLRDLDKGITEANKTGSVFRTENAINDEAGKTAEWEANRVHDQVLKDSAASNKRELGRLKEEFKGIASDDKAKAKSIADENAQMARNLDARDKYLKGVEKEENKATAAQLKNREDADKATVRQLINDQKAGVRANKAVQGSVHEQGRLSKQVAAEEKIKAQMAAQGLVPGEPSISDVDVTDTGTGKRTMKTPYRVPEEDAPEGGSGGGEGSGGGNLRVAPKFGTIFQSRAAADAAAAQLGEDVAGVKVLDNGFKIVPKERLKAAAVPPKDIVTDSEMKSLGLPDDSEPPTTPTVPKKPSGPKGGGGGGAAPLKDLTGKTTNPPYKPTAPRTKQGAGNRVPAAKAVADHANDEEAIFNSLAADAMQQGYRGDPDVLRSAFNEKMAHARDLHAEMAGHEVESDPANLFRKISSYGGLTDESGEFNKFVDKTSGTARGIRGVVKVKGGGKTPDEIVHRLGQDPQFAHIKTPRDLYSAMEEAATKEHATTSLASAAEGAGLKKGTKWWEAAVPADENIEAAQDRAVERRKADFTRRVSGAGGRRSTDIAGEPSDVIGERSYDQPFPKVPPGFEPPVPPPSEQAQAIAAAKAASEATIPGLEDVRNIENPTPKVAEEPGFSLTSEASTAPTAVENPVDLFSKQAEANAAPREQSAFPYRSNPEDKFATAQDVADTNYRNLQAATKAGDLSEFADRPRPEQPARRAGAAAQRLSKEQAASNPDSDFLMAMPPEQRDAVLKKIAGDALKRLGKGQKGEIDPFMMQLLTRAGTGTAGALIGGAVEPDDPLHGALVGGLMGAAAPSVIEQLNRVRTGEIHPIEGFDHLTERLPNWQRSSLLYHPLSLWNNAVLGPWGSGVTGALEEIGSGNQTGKAALAEMRPDKWGRRAVKALKEAGELIEANDPNRAEWADPLNHGVIDSYAEFPAKLMVAGDIATKEGLIESGIDEARAAEIGLRAEPDVNIHKVAKAIVNAGKEVDDFGKRGIIFQMMFPFRRTVANILMSTPERTPGLGVLLKFYRDYHGLENRDWQRVATQQRMSGMIMSSSFVLGYLTPPEFDKSFKIHNAITNMAGQYGILAGVAFAAGQAKAQGKSMAKNIVSTATQSVPLPTTQPLEDILRPTMKAVTGEWDTLGKGDIPRELVPGWFGPANTALHGIAGAAEKSAPSSSPAPVDPTEFMRRLRENRGKNPTL